MRERKTVLLDCDGVLANFIEPLLDEVHEVTGRVYKPEDVTRFDFAKSLGLTDDEARAVKRIVSEQPGWWSKLPVFDGAREGVARLQDVADVYIVTSPWNSCPTWLHEREAWLKRWFNIPHARVLAGSAKHLVAGDVFVDDKTETCALWERHQGYVESAPGGYGETFAVQWITPHNRLDDWEGRATNSWAQLAEWVRG